jgi:hypothetical protein
VIRRLLKSSRREDITSALLLLEVSGAGSYGRELAELASRSDDKMGSVLHVLSLLGETKDASIQARLRARFESRIRDERQNEVLRLAAADTLLKWFGALPKKIETQLLRADSPHLRLRAVLSALGRFDRESKPTPREAEELSALLSIRPQQIRWVVWEEIGARARAKPELWQALLKSKGLDLCRAETGSSAVLKVCREVLATAGIVAWREAMGEEDRSTRKPASTQGEWSLLNLFDWLNPRPRESASPQTLPRQVNEGEDETRAGESDEGWRDNYRDQLRDTVEALKRVRQQVEEQGLPCLQCSRPWVINEGMSAPQAARVEERLNRLQTPEERQRFQACQESYQRLFARDVIDVRVAVGYLDFGNSVTDRYFRASLEAALTDRCPRNSQGQLISGRRACDFRRAADDANVLTRQIMGPDGRPRTVRLTLVSSSVTNDEWENRREKANEQQRSTARAESVFFNGLREADVVIYAGHARGGGGPSFEAPRLRPSQGRLQSTDFAWYRRERPGARRMIESLQRAERQPGLIALLACDADKHFADAVREVAPNSALIVAGRDSIAETSMGQVFAILDLTLAQHCQASFQNALRETSTWIDGRTLEPPKALGLFEPPRRPTR